MDLRDATRLVECLPGRYVLVQAVPGWPVIAVSRSRREPAALPAVAGRPLAEVFPESPAAPGSAAHLAAAFERVVAQRAPARHEQRYDLVDPATGRFVERYWAMRVAPVLDEAGAVECLLLHAEDATTGARGGSMAILDAMTEGVFTLDRQWRFAYVNPEAYRILRQPPGSLEGAVIWERFPGSEDGAFGEHYKRTMLERETSRFTALYPGLEGWYEVTVYPAPEGISVYFRDVTARVLAEHERERIAAESDRQRRLYETALNNTPDFVYIFGTDHRAIYANDALRRVWGVDDVRGRTWIELGYEQWHADMHDRELAQVIATRAPIRGEIPFTGTNGRRIYDYIFAPVFGPDGEVVAVAGTTRDVTERKAAEQIVREHADRLADADRAKDAFLATLSHELRNPLAPLRNGVEVLRRMAGDASPQSAVHSMMERQVNHLVRLVDDLMEISRITRGIVSLQVETLSLEAIVDSAVETVRPLVDAAGHRLSVELPSEPVWLDGDRVRLAQILSNLLNNAAKYSDAGSEIALRAHVDDGTLVIAVHDDGIGMDPGEIEHLFEMFTRSDRVRTGRKGGLGIGLALARRLAAQHGGTLTARSDGPGQGSVFELRLPCHAGEAPPMPSDAGEAPALALRVLVVDDNTDVGESLVQALRLAGAEARFEPGGAAALEAFDAFAPDVVISDVGMPQVTGYDLATALRARGVTVPLIALTGWGQPADRERALAAGFDHHLVKPVAIPLLLRLLQSLGREAAVAVERM